MRTLILTLLALFCAFCCNAQRVLNLHMNDGSLHQFPVSEIKLMDFDNPQSRIFDFNFEINGPAVRMTCIPQDDNIKYFFSFVAKKDVDESGLDVKGHLQKVIDNYIDMFSSNMTVDEIIDALASYSGTEEYSFTANGNEDYYAYALTLTRDAKIEHLDYKPFRTGNVEPSDNVISITIDEIGYDRIIYNLTTLNQDPLTVVFKPSANYIGLTDDEILNKILKEGNGKFTTTSGPGNNESYQFMYNGLAPGVEYLALAFGYYGGCATTSLVKVPFTTKAAGDASKMNFDFNVSNLTSFDATISVTPNPESCLYYWDILTDKQNPESVKQYLRDQANMFVQKGYCDTYADAMRRICYRGNSSFSYNSLTPGTIYKPFGIAINDVDGSFATDIIFGESFTTPAMVVSEATVDIIFDQYFKIDDAFLQFFPWMTADAGMACAPIIAQPSSDATTWYFNTYTYDASDVEQYPDSEMVLSLIQSNNKNINKINFILPFNQPCTIMAVAKDSEGNFGEVVRQVIILTEEGTSTLTDPGILYAPKEKVHKRASSRVIGHTNNLYTPYLKSKK